MSQEAQANEPGLERQRSNVLFIAVDDLNDWVGFLEGHPNAETPNLDRLAARGTVFTNAHCAAPACNPSRVAVLTGMRPTRSGVYFNRSKWRTPLPDVRTLPEVFGAAGYTTVCVGKLTHQDAPALWNRFVHLKGGVFDDDVKTVGRLEWSALDVEEERLLDNRIARHGAKVLREDHDRPFFLACGFYRPHLAWAVPKEHFEALPLRKIALPHVPGDDLPSDLDDLSKAALTMKLAEGDEHAAVLAEEGAWREAVRAYLASIRFFDQQLGVLLDALDASPYRDTTIVCLWSDHGFHLGEKSHWRKFTLWEESTRVPFVFAGPGVTPGQRCSRPVELVSTFATMTALADLETPAWVDGPSLAPWLRDASLPLQRPALTTYGPGNHALRDERWRYVRYADGSEELYDHDADPHEWRNLAADPELDAIRSGFTRWLPQNETPPTPLRRKKRAH